jgi:DNA-binding protein H-NS
MAKGTRRQTRKASRKTRKAPVPTTRRGRPPATSSKATATIESLTLPELDALIKAATAKRDKLMTGARASFVDEVRARAASLGMSLADLAGLSGRAVPQSSGAARAPRRDARRKSPAPKYRNPATGETWAGRGRPARWLTELEARGHKREEFAVE